ncbi:MAG: amidohydrolase [Clostridioides sp.]|nr:amidohydrolase [Clostridioides sp.]
MSEDIIDWVIQIRRDLHRTPELGLSEFTTKKKILKYLKEIGIEYTCFEYHTGVMAFVDAGAEKTVALRADMDGLPLIEDVDIPFKSENYGIMHACGHDAHTAILLGVCRAIYSIKDELNVNVKFFFQPAEETIGGARLMIEDGCMHAPKVDCIFGLHVDPTLETGKLEVKYGTLNASTDTINISVLGKNGHAGYPQFGIDAIVAASHVITALQTIVSRNVDPADSVVLSFGVIQGGVKENITCDAVNIRGTLRTLNEKNRIFVKQRISELSELIAKSFGGRAIVDIEKGYPVLVNDDSVMDYIKKNATEVLGNDKIVVRENSSLGAEDFSYFSEKCRGGFFHIGCGTTSSLLHTATFNLNEDCLIVGLMVSIKNILSFGDMEEE